MHAILLPTPHVTQTTVVMYLQGEGTVLGLAVKEGCTTVLTHMHIHTYVHSTMPVLYPTPH